MINQTYLAKVIDDTKCEGDKDALLEISRTLFLNVVGLRDNSTGTVELEVDFESGKNSR